MSKDSSAHQRGKAGQQQQQAPRRDRDAGQQQEQRPQDKGAQRDRQQPQERAKY